jgi:hypothetical protein
VSILHGPGNLPPSVSFHELKVLSIFYVVVVVGLLAARRRPSLQVPRDH